MFKNPKFYLIALCALVVATGAALFSTEQKKAAVKMPEPTVIVFNHPNWTDEMMLEGKDRMFRDSAPGEKATIIEKTENSYTILWDRWGTETFVKQADGSYSLQNKG